MQSKSHGGFSGPGQTHYPHYPQMFILSISSLMAGFFIRENNWNSRHSKFLAGHRFLKNGPPLPERFSCSHGQKTAGRSELGITQALVFFLPGGKEKN